MPDRKPFPLDEVPISQSLIKAVDEYRAGKMCGLLLKALYVDRSHRKRPSEAQRLGIWFEFCATGQLPFYSEELTVPFLKGGKMPKPYKDAQDRAQMVRPMIQALGFEIVETGRCERQTLAIDNGKNVYNVLTECNTDISARFVATKQPYTIDLKFSGLLNQTYGPYAWGTPDKRAEHLGYKPKITLQAKHYVWALDVPFIWLVWPTNDKVKAPAFIEATPTDEAIARHEAHVLKTALTVSAHNKNGWKAKPNMELCASCPLSEDCEFKTTSPEWETITLE